MEEITKLLKKYTVEEIAVKVGVSAQTIWRWKNNGSTPHRTFQKKLQQILKQEATHET